jgi:hypothetical protein
MNIKFEYIETMKGINSANYIHSTADTGGLTMVIGVCRGGTEAGATHDTYSYTYIIADFDLRRSGFAASPSGGGAADKRYAAGRALCRACRGIPWPSRLGARCGARTPSAAEREYIGHGPWTNKKCTRDS